MSAQRLGALDEIVPSQQELLYARESNRFGNGMFQPAEWTKFVWTPPTARPPISLPDHLSDAPARQIFAQGYWCTDFTFSYDGPGSHFVQENQWQLPRRWRMAGAFKTSLVGDSFHSRPPSPRRSRGGRLGVFVCLDHPVETVNVPTAAEAMQHALAADGAWQDPNADDGRIQPFNKVLWIRPSNEARYLIGVLGMTGGLQRAGSFLLDPFLQATFAALGGTLNLPANRVGETISRLQKMAPRIHAFDLHSEREREALGRLIVKAAQTLKDPLHFVRYEALKERWKDYRAAYWAANPQPKQPDTDVDWDLHEERSLDYCLMEMRRRQMVFQGHQWTCRECYHRNWVDLAALSSELFCQVCKRPSQAPIDIRWLFRPNEFLIESLRDHSILSIIWLLTKLCERARSSFVYVGPTCFGFTREEDPEAEVDLLVLVDGQTILCEVKSSWRGLRSSDVSDLVTLAGRLRPDVALLGIMEAASGPTSELDAARQQLNAQGIGFEVVTLDARNREDGPYLHYD